MSDAPMKRILRPSRGFSLLEVLVALLIFSLGLLGLAGLLVVSVKVNNGAYIRTQANFLAQSLADRMRANMAAVWENGYDGDYPETGTPPACAVGAACSTDDVATRDRTLWSQQLVDLMPNPTATVLCERNSATVVSAVSQRDRTPYDGLCTITMQWTEAGLDAQDEDAGTRQQTFAWVFQP